VAQLVERRVNRKVAKSWVVVAQPDERHANRTASVLEWYDRHRACNIWFTRKKRKPTI